MSTIIVWNKGRRQWDLTNASGEEVKLGPNESIEMDEVAGLRKIKDYPADFTESKVSGPSGADLKRREQSIRDREANLDEREKALKEREKALKPEGDPEKRKPGRPAKAEAAIEE